MRRIALITVICAFIAAPASADLVDPDAFAVGTDISNAFAGVSLSALGSGWGGVTGPEVYAINSAAQPLEPFSASTGSLVFGHSGFYPHLWMDPGTIQLRADFALGATDVQLDFIGNNHSDFGQLLAYDAGGTLVDSAYTGQLTLSAVETLTVSGDISYVIGGGINTASSLGMDNLQFTPVPVPGAVLLGMLGLSVASLKLRKFA